MQRRAKRRVSGKRQLLLHCKYADSLPLLYFNLRLARQDECRLRKIHLARESLYFTIIQAARVGKNGERIAGKRRPRKYVKLHEFVTARHLWAFALSDDFLDLNSTFLLSILLRSNMFHPLNHLAIQPLLNGDMSHRGPRRTAMPVLFTGANQTTLPGRISCTNVALEI